MRALVIIGAALIVVGIIGFAIGGVPVKQNETQAQLGNLKLEAETQKTYPIPGWASGAAIAIGVIVLGVGIARRT